MRLLVLKILIAISIILGTLSGTLHWYSTNIRLERVVRAAPIFSQFKHPVISAEIKYDGESFSPSVVTIRPGDLIKIINISDNTPVKLMSDPFPVANNNRDINLGVLNSGYDQVFSTTRTGTWTYHNQLDPIQTGTIIVL